jgi:hypothetical protein
MILRGAAKVPTPNICVYELVHVGDYIEKAFEDSLLNIKANNID